MKKILASLSVMTVAVSAMAQSIGPKELQDIRASFVKDPATVATQNMLSTHGNINALAVSKDAGNLDNIFKYEVKALPSAPNQYTSGRCWLFTSLNDIRPYAIEKFNVKDFRFSHVYDSFWDLFEKSNLFLENIIRTAGSDIDDREVQHYFKTPVGDGGVWNMFISLTEKYGVVPESVMPETVHSNNTANMRTILNQKLRAEGWNIRKMAENGSKEKELRAYKLKVMKDVYRILALCEGEPPMEFTWSYKDKSGVQHSITTTPQEFYKSFIPKEYRADNFVMIMNDPTREYYKVYDIAGYKDVIEGLSWKFLNLPNDVIKAGVLASIKDNNPVYISCDWRKGQISDKGVCVPEAYDYESLFGVNFDMDRSARLLTHQSTSAHAMLITACDTDENDKPVKWRFFNSYFMNKEKVNIIFSDQWFDEYMFRVMLERKYLTKEVLSIFDKENKKPVFAPIWDHMN